MKMLPPRFERLFMVMMALFFALPLPLTILAHVQQFKKVFRFGGKLRLAGMQSAPSIAPFSRSALFNAKYQESLARFFDEEFFGRGPLIKLTNEIYFRLFKTCPMKSASLAVGREDTLYEELYLEEYCFQRIDKDKLSPLVRNIKHLQDACERNGTGFVLLITPSKAAVDPQFIPSEWMRGYDPKPRGYAELLPLLKDQGVHYVDGHALTVKAKSRAPAPVFPKGGIHWGQYAAWSTANALLALLHTQGIALQPMEYSSLRVSDIPKDSDSDILDLMNLAVPWRYPVAELEIKPIATSVSPRPNLVIIGGSFILQLADLLKVSNQFSEIDYYYYYKIYRKSYADGKSRLVENPVPSIDFAREIFAADCLVLEINEGIIPTQHHLSDFLSDALKNAPVAGKPKEPFRYESLKIGK